MLVAIIAALLDQGIVDYTLILAGFMASVALSVRPPRGWLR
jgi:hypothetical protein